VKTETKNIIDRLRNNWEIAGYLNSNFDCRNEERIAIPADNGIVIKKILKIFKALLKIKSLSVLRYPLINISEKKSKAIDSNEENIIKLINTLPVNSLALFLFSIKSLLYAGMKKFCPIKYIIILMVTGITAPTR
jgi:hypothetical protein